MRFTLYTLFPGLIEPYLGEALLGRALERRVLEVVVRDLRRFAGNRTGRVDDAPYGGGAGMILRVDVAAAAVDEAAKDAPPPDEVVLLSPGGEPLRQPLVEHFAGLAHVVLLSGRYEGFDARAEALATREVSIGDFVLMGGELPALCLVEAVARLLPGVLGDADSHAQDSFTTGLLDYPEYTRPSSFRGEEVPDVLLSGHHQRVRTWRRRQALARTLARRPDLLHRAPLDEEDRRALLELGWDAASAAQADPAGGDPTGGRATRGHTAGGHAAGGRSAGGRATGGRATGGHTAGGPAEGRGPTSLGSADPEGRNPEPSDRERLDPEPHEPERDDHEPHHHERDDPDPPEPERDDPEPHHHEPREPG